MTAPIEHSAQLQIPASGPMFDGHFPGHPVLPGARLLDLVLAAIGAGLDAGTIGSKEGNAEVSRDARDDSKADAKAQPALQVHVAKFLAPVAPGAMLRLDWRIQAGGRIAFECRDGTERVASGTVSRHAAPGDAQTQEPRQ